MCLCFENPQDTNKNLLTPGPTSQIEHCVKQHIWTLLSLLHSQAVKLLDQRQTYTEVSFLTDLKRPLSQKCLQHTVHLRMQ